MSGFPLKRYMSSDKSLSSFLDIIGSDIEDKIKSNYEDLLYNQWRKQNANKVCDIFNTAFTIGYKMDKVKNYKDLLHKVIIHKKTYTYFYPIYDFSMNTLHMNCNHNLMYEVFDTSSKNDNISKKKVIYYKGDIYDGSFKNKQVRVEDQFPFLKNEKMIIGNIELSRPNNPKYYSFIKNDIIKKRFYYFENFYLLLIRWRILKFNIS